jgi:hypothetical protein
MRLNVRPITRASPYLATGVSGECDNCRISFGSRPRSAKVRYGKRKLEVALTIITITTIEPFYLQQWL